MAEELTIERQAADLAMRFIGSGEYIKERRESLAANILELVSTIRRDTWDEACRILSGIAYKAQVGRDNDKAKANTIHDCVTAIEAARDKVEP